MNRTRVSKRVEKKLAKAGLLEASDLENVNLGDCSRSRVRKEPFWYCLSFQQNKGLGWFVSKDKVQSSFLLKRCLDKERREVFTSSRQDLDNCLSSLQPRGRWLWRSGQWTLWRTMLSFSWYNSY